MTVGARCQGRTSAYPCADNSEYIADCDARRAYISGFTGSAGRAAVTADEALLWTDGRYFLQAEKELHASCWTLMKAGEPDVPPLSTWLMDKFGYSDASRIGIDPKVVTFEMAKTLKEQLQEKEGDKQSKRELVAVQENLVDEIWKGDKTEDGKGGKPEQPASEVFVLVEKYTGRSISDKLDQLRRAMNKANSAGIVVSMLDEVAWLFNLRGSDIIYNPVSASHHWSCRPDRRAGILLVRHRHPDGVHTLRPGRIDQRPSPIVPRGEQGLCQAVRLDLERSLRAGQGRRILARERSCQAQGDRGKGRGYPAKD